MKRILLLLLCLAAPAGLIYGQAASPSPSMNAVNNFPFNFSSPSTSNAQILIYDPAANGAGKPAVRLSTLGGGTTFSTSTNTFATTRTWLGQTVFLTGTAATYTPTTGTGALRIRMIGGGGGGGGTVNSSASEMTTCGGGGSGSYLEKLVTIVSGTYTYTVGAGGAGGANTGATGSSGTSSTFVNGANTYTAPAGAGGVNMASGTSVLIASGGAGGAISTIGGGQGTGDVLGGGASGGLGLRLNGSIGRGGGGASTFLGGGAIETAAAGAAGANAIANTGSGGGGATSANASGAAAGGNGAAGIIIIDEYR